MTRRDEKPGDAARAEREKRLADALRENLKRRKMQARGRWTEASGEPSAAKPEPPQE